MSATRVYVMLGIASLIALVWIGFSVWFLVDGRWGRGLVGMAAGIIVIVAAWTRGAKVLRAAGDPGTNEPG